MPLEWFLSAILVFCVLIGALTLWDRSRQSRNVNALVASGAMKVADRLDAAVTTVLFDSEKRQLGIVSSAGATVVPFDQVREWSYKTEMTPVDGKLIGYMFRISTTDPGKPLHTLLLATTDRNVPELWMSKFAAHING